MYLPFVYDFNSMYVNQLFPSRINFNRNIHKRGVAIMSEVFVQSRCCCLTNFLYRIVVYLVCAALRYLFATTSLLYMPWGLPILVIVCDTWALKQRRFSQPRTTSQNLVLVR